MKGKNHMQQLSLDAAKVRRVSELPDVPATPSQTNLSDRSSPARPGAQ